MHISRPVEEGHRTSKMAPGACSWETESNSMALTGTDSTTQRKAAILAV